MSKKIAFGFLSVCLFTAGCHSVQPKISSVEPNVSDDANLDLRGWSLTPKGFGPWKFGMHPDDKPFTKFCLQAQKQSDPTDKLVLVCKARYDTGFMSDMELFVTPMFSKQGNDESLSALKIEFPFDLPTSTSDKDQTLYNTVHFVRQASMSKAERIRLKDPVAWAPITQVWTKDPNATEAEPFVNATLIPNPHGEEGWEPRDIAELLHANPSIHMLIKVKGMNQSYLEISSSSYVLFHKQDPSI